MGVKLNEKKPATGKDRSYRLSERESLRGVQNPYYQRTLRTPGYNYRQCGRTSS